MSPVAIGQVYGGGLAGAPTRVGLQPPTGRVPKVSPGEVVFVCSAPAITLRCKLGASSATPAGGVGGWRTVEIPGREDGIEWGSLPGRTLQVPIVLGFDLDHSIEAEVSALQAMGRPPAGSPRGTPPPVIRLGGMVPHRGRDWVLTDLAEGDAIWDGRREHRIRLFLAVSLLAYRELDLVVVTPKKANATPATRVHVVKRGESLGSIARDQMGAKTASAIAKGVTQLKSLNNLRDPKSITVGQRLKVPR